MQRRGREERGREGEAARDSALGEVAQLVRVEHDGPDETQVSLGLRRMGPSEPELESSGDSGADMRQREVVDIGLLGAGRIGAALGGGATGGRLLGGGRAGRAGTGERRDRWRGWGLEETAAGGGAEDGRGRRPAEAGSRGRRRWRWELDLARTLTRALMGRARGRGGCVLGSHAERMMVLAGEARAGRTTAKVAARLVGRAAAWTEQDVRAADSLPVDVVVGGSAVGRRRGAGAGGGSVRRAERHHTQRP